MHKVYIFFIGFFIILFSFIPDILLIGDPGIGATQIYPILIGTIFIIISVFINIDKLDSRKCIFKQIRFYLPAISIVIISAASTFIITDVILRYSLGSIYERNKYGWRVGADTAVQWMVEDTPGNSREVTNEYFFGDFKRWPNSNKSRRTLILGDSFTHMYWVSNGEEWYSYLENEFKEIEFYVFGGGGYGPLQEYMVLDDYFDIIMPSSIIWQFCSKNDYENSLFELDLSTYPKNNFGFRPYLEHNIIRHRMPLPLSGLRQVSFIFDRLLASYDRFQRRGIIGYEKNESTRRNITTLKKVNALERQAFEVVLEVMKRVRSRAGSIPIYLFDACGSISENEMKICEYISATCVSGLYEFIRREKKGGKKLQIVGDGHWNFAGNKEVGQWLVQYFKREESYL